MNIYDSGYDNLKDHAQRYGIREVPEETGFIENFNATSEFFTQEMTSMSEQHMIGDQVSDAVKLYKNLNPNKKDDGLTKINLGDTKLSGGLGALEYNKQFLEDNHQAILDLQLQYPDAGLKTIDDIMAEAKEKARLTREKLSSTSANSSGVGKLGMVAGGIYGTFHDPVLLASMVIGSGKIKGPSKAANAWKAFKTEAAIGAGAEMLITPSVMSWRDKLDSPYSLKEATINILTVGGFAGVTRAGGSYVVDVFEARKAISSLRAAGKDGEADVVESYVEMQERGTGNMDAHLKAYEQAQISLQKGKIIEQAELDKITGGKVGIESIDPRTIEVDAKTFQFKSRGDDQGVTDALEGVNKWDPIKANTSIVWERLDGTRFIADGHQRLALAKRLIGDDAQEIGLNAFIMREADGFTAEQVRDIAAFKNIAEGSGSALDAAKVIRSGNQLGDDLPPNSALVRDARGLARLDDEAFRLVVDEIVDARYGAIVGELISDAAEQSAVIRALAQAKPANANQARLMVGDMKAAGFTKTETVDLFGGMEVTESLFKERAKVIDNVMRQVKKDKSVFKTLAEQESRIAGAGNKLDRDANLTRLSDDEKTLATLTSLANTKGSVSDLINDAARRIKEGESVQRATRDILPELRRAGDEQLNVRTDDVGSADGLTPLRQQIDELPEDVTRPKIMPEEHPAVSIKVVTDDKGKKTARVVIDRSKLDIEADNFGYPKLQKVLKDGDPLLVDTSVKHALKKGGYKAARKKLQQKWIDKFLAKGEVSDKPVVWLTGGGGASGKGTVLKKLQKEGVIKEKGFVHIDADEIKKKIPEYNKINDSGDYRGAAVVHKESSYVSKELIRQATAQRKNMIIDKTLGNPEKALKMIKTLKAKGYDVRLLGVTIDPSEALIRALERFYGSGRLVPANRILKAHKGFNANFEQYAKAVDGAFLYDNSVKPTKIYKSKGNEIEIVSKSEYNIQGNRGNLDEKAANHKQLRESQGLPGRLDGSSGKSPGRDSGGVGAAAGRDSSAGDPGRAQPHQRLNDQGVRRGVVGDKLTAGGTLATQTGRETTPFPANLDTSTNRKALNTSARIDKWLIENAIEEARSRGDNFNLRQFEQDLPLTNKAENLPQASKDSAELYLFGDNIPAARQNSLRELDTTVERTRLNDQLKDTGLDLDDPYLNELHAAELKQVDDLLLDADIEIPTGIKVVDGENVVEFRSAREVIKELDDESKVVDDMFKCMGE